MAVFWKNIKGMAEDGNNNTHYTYIEFPTDKKQEGLVVKFDNETLGNCALSNSNYPQHITQLTVVDIGAKDSSQSQRIHFTKELVTVDLSTTFKSSIAADSVSITKNLTAKTVVVDTASITGECQAGFFNATSDKRAKENFEPLSTEAALKTVLDTPLYSFDYKSGARSIGVLAQDLIHVDMNNFSFVGNQKASGQNGDYMNVHESKFIYLLWAAIQEQQKEIESLRAQLKQFLKGTTFLTGCRAFFPFL